MTRVLNWANRIHYYGPFDDLLLTFHTNRATMIEVVDTPRSVDWYRMCTSFPGLLKIRRFRGYSWYKFATPDQACRFMAQVHYNGHYEPIPKARGVFTRCGLTFEQIMEDACYPFERVSYLRTFDEPPFPA